MEQQTLDLFGTEEKNDPSKISYKTIPIRAQNEGVSQPHRILSGQYLGASEVNIIMTEATRSQFNLAQEKVGIIPKKEVNNQYTRYGTKMEPYIINEIEKKEYNFLVEKKRCHEYKLSGVVDGIDYSRNTILEVKTYFNQPSFDSYINQIHVYFHIWRMSEAILAIYQYEPDFDAKNIEVYNIKRDEERLQNILRAVKKFWYKAEILRNNRDMKKQEFDKLEEIK